MNRFHPVLATALLFFVFILPGVPAVAAQELPEDTTEVVPLPDLTVTVLRDVTPVRLSPYAVTAADADELRRGRSGAFLEEALGGLPGVQLQNRFNYAVGERLAIRGFGPRAQFGVRGVKVLVDGIPATMPDGQSTLDHVDIASLGRAEVLRGPGSALYGNGAGGVLVLTSEAPTSGPVRPDARVVVGSDGLVNLTGGADGTVGRVGVSLNAGVLRYDGFRSNPVAPGDGDQGDDDPDDVARYGEAERELFNGQLVAPLGAGTLRLSVATVTLAAENPGSLPRDSIDRGSASAWGGNVHQGTRKDMEQAQAGLVWDGPVGDGHLEAAAWGIGRSLVNPIPPAVVALRRRAGGARLIFTGGGDAGGNQGEGPSEGFTWGMGAEAELQRDDRQNYENVGGETGPLGLDQLETVRALGGFARAGLGTGRVRVTAALRYDHFRFEADDRFAWDLPGVIEPDDSGERAMDAWSPSVGVVFTPGAGFSIWANVATSLETPTTTELVNRPGGSGGFNPELDPQRSLGFEAGARGRVGSRVRWELVTFLTSVDDELVPFEDPAQPGRTFFRNAGESEHDGMEASVEVDADAGFRFRAVVARTDARFVSYEVDGRQIAGNRVPGLAPNRLQMLVGQERPRFFWTVDAEWNDDVPVDDANEESADAHWLVDARAGLVDLRLGDVVFSPFAGVQNLFDERYTASVTVNAFGGRYYEPGPGRTGYLGLSLGWDRR